MQDGEYDREAAERQIELSSPDVRHYVRSLRDTIDAARAEIMRLSDVIDSHTSRVSGLVVGNYAPLPTMTAIDVDGMRTVVRAEPRLGDFYLAEPLAGYSPDHRRAFHKQVVTGFTEMLAEDIARSIWSAQKPQ